MTILLESKLPLPEAQLISWLSALRENSLVENSQFAVAAIIEIKLKAGVYIYVGGVNIENTEHNRLSMHAEQNAAVAAQTLVGGETRFSRLWVMGAPAKIKMGSAQAAANKFVMPCGHCRQILLSLAIKDFEIYPVTVNGTISPAFKLADLLPEGFSENDLDLADDLRGGQVKINDFSLCSARLQLLSSLLEQAKPFSSQDILNRMNRMSPHIINPQFKTSTITACILRLAEPSCYLPGVLVQDVAFLTTDAIFAAVGLAVTLEGGKNLEFTELHLLGDSFKGVQLSNSELQVLSQFIKKDLPIYCYTPDGLQERTLLSACLREKANAALLRLTST